MIDICTDQAFIKEFVLEDSIWSKIGDDIHKHDTYKPDMDDLWLSISIDGEVVGLCEFSMVNSITVQIHPHFPDNWKHKGREGITKCISWLKNQDIRRIDKVNAMIPTCYVSVYNCAKRIGFSDEGVSKNCFLKNGEVYDQYYLGLELKRWEAIGNE